ncbi:MAG: adenylate/guanylate cyclase domain-containing protein [Rhodospirillales bacterium]
MRIKFKILAIAYVLLLLFGIAVGLSVVQQARIRDELGAIIDYPAPVVVAISDFDVGTSDYELALRRLSRQSSPTAGDIAAAQKRIDELAKRISDDLTRVLTLLNAAVADSRNTVGDRLLLSRMLGATGNLKTHIAQFLELGQRTMTLLREGKQEEALDELSKFQAFETTFGPELAVIRAELTNLAHKSMGEALEAEQANLMLSIGLFALAAAIGLAFSIWIAGHIIAALRRLISGAQALERGEPQAALPVTVRDEIGQLTEAFNRMIEELRAKERIKETFGRFVDPRIVSKLIARADDNPDAAERRIATIFFSDIRGFSGIGEQLTPAAMVNLLNRYFTLASAAVRDNRGIVDKYIGDSVMAFWTQPFSPSERDQAIDACKSALAHFRAALALRDELPEILGIRRNLPKFTIRMGLATGDVVVGTVGSAIAKSYTVIGDTVNLASRLEGINKGYGTRILIDEKTRTLADEAIEAREIDLVVVAGKTEPIRIFQLMAEKGGLDEKRRQVWEAYARGLAAYRAGDWAGADEAFARCLSLDPNDGPSKTFAKRVKALAGEPPQGWDGVWKAETK